MPNKEYVTGNTFATFFPGEPTPEDSLYPKHSFGLDPNGWIWVMVDNTSDASIWKLFLHRHGVSKAWVVFSGNDASIQNSFEVASVTRKSTGKYMLTFNREMDSSYYAVSAQALGNGIFTSILSMNAGSVTISTSAVILGATVSVDPDIVTVSILSTT